VAPDVRGHGDSDRVGAGGYYHFMDYVADLASVIAQTARARVSLVGHSMGGSIAAYYAGAFPERVHRLALLEGLGPPEDDPLLPERVARWIAAWERARQATPGAYDDIAAAARRLQSVDPLLDHALALELAEAGTRALDDGRRIFKHDPVHLTRGPYPFRLEVAESFWRSVACPVLIVEGETSPFRQLQGLDRRIACFADVRREVIPGAAHMLQRHQPERLAELLIEHLSDATPAQGKAP
jgi:pimeloyl-ACP methyl ester carboxylesterase